MTIRVNQWDGTDNYAKIRLDENHKTIYYYVSGAKYLSATLFEISLDIDVLATYRDEIMSTQAYVVYSSNAYRTQFIDTRLPVLQSQYTRRSVHDMDELDSTGVFLLTTISDDQTSRLTGFASTYYLSAASLRDFAYKFNNLDDDIIDTIVRYFEKPFDSIISLKWLPFSEATIQQQAGQIGNIHLGTYDMAIPAYIMRNPVKSYVTLLDIPWEWTDWRGASDYSKFILYLPSYGSLPLNADLMRGYTQIYVARTYDMSTGDVSYMVRGDGVDGQILGVAQGNTAVDMPIGQTTNNLGSVAAGAAGIAASIATGNPATALSSLGNVISGIRPNYETIGRLGGRSSINDLFQKMELVFSGYCINDLDYNDNFAAIMGKPRHSVDQLSIHAGQYVQCNSASVAIDGYAGECAQVNGYLNSGVYLE